MLVDELKQDKLSSPKDEAEDEFEKDANIDMSKVQDVELDMEIALISNAIIFFFAGFDTTSSTLAMVSPFTTTEHFDCLTSTENLKLLSENCSTCRNHFLKISLILFIQSSGLL